MVNTPIYKGRLQSDLDFAGFNALNFPGGGGGSNPLITIGVKDPPYNAKGDGVTDDTVAIQNAINALFALGGGTLFFRKGVYLCNGALDPTTNSILRLPIQNNFTGHSTVPIELLGEVYTGYVDVGSPGGSEVTIRTTRSPSGTFPALFAANVFTAGDNPDPSLFNNVLLRTKNLNFYSSSLSGLRLDACGYALIENTHVFGTSYPGVPPANTVGIWMPKTGNNAINYANNILAAGFDVGLRIGEHFRCPNFVVGSANTGILFTFASESSYAAGLLNHCVHNIAFSGAHSVDVFADIEYADPGAPDAWAVTTADIYDPSNFGGGLVRYNLVKANVGVIEDNALVTGGAKIKLINLHTGNITTVAKLPAAGSIGQTYAVTDGAASPAWGATVTGGGSAKYLCVFNGVNWTVAGK